MGIPTITPRVSPNKAMKTAPPANVLTVNQQEPTRMTATKQATA